MQKLCHRFVGLMSSNLFCPSFDVALNKVWQKGESRGVPGKSRGSCCQVGENNGSPLLDIEPEVKGYLKVQCCLAWPCYLSPEQGKQQSNSEKAALREG